MLFKKYNLFYIPNYVYLFYFKKSNMIILKFHKKIKFLKFKNKNYLILLHNSIILFKKNKKYQKKIIFIFKQLLIELENKIYKKLKLIGIGYKVLVIKIKKLKTKFLAFKLGFSHFIFLKFKISINVSCVKNSNIFISSNYLLNILNFISKIKVLKTPEPYNSKGILYYNETIILKKNNKI